MLQKADAMQQIQRILRGLADETEAGTIAPIVSGIRTRVDVEKVLHGCYDPGEQYGRPPELRCHYPVPNVERSRIPGIAQELMAIGETSIAAEISSYDYRQHPRISENVTFDEELFDAFARADSVLSELAKKDRNHGSSYLYTGRVAELISEQRRMVKLGINNEDNLRDARAELLAINKRQLAKRSTTQVAQRTAIERERERNAFYATLRTKGIPGFFPTPSDLAARMVQEADIYAGMSVLEPSAGVGSIAEEIRKVGVRPDVVEFNYGLREYLQGQGGYNVLPQNDFLSVTGQWDRIVMNPPFEREADIDHVRHAYDLLAPGGRIVAIMSAGPFFRSDRKAVDFRNWLDSLGGTHEPLPAGSFEHGIVPTSVNTELVIVDKA